MKNYAMGRIYDIMKYMPAAVVVLAATGCSDETDVISSAAETIAVQTREVDGGSRAAAARDNTFMVLFWTDYDKLESDADNSAWWTSPYLAARAPQPVGFYEHMVFDTDHAYPKPEATPLYATGYAPGHVLVPDETAGYRKLSAQVSDASDKGRYDFLSCDVWHEVYKGSQSDPFSQEKNRLYFRHLSSKLLFYADRDRETMENKQYVRNVQVKNLQMSIDGGTTWTPMHTPSSFEWQILNDDDFTASYTEIIGAVRTVAGNEEAYGTRPKAGYKAAGSETFAGDDSGYVLKGNEVDLVPIGGMRIDSCYVCNPFENGKVKTNQAIRLKMDISAELSFSQDFPLPDGDGTATDNLTFTREWKGATLSAIYKVDKDGIQQTAMVDEFKPGCEYRIHIRFNRTGVNLVARELPWNYGGIHYVTIPGGGNQNDTNE